MLGGVSSWKKCCYCCFSCSSTWICLLHPLPLCLLLPHSLCPFWGIPEIYFCFRHFPCDLIIATVFSDVDECTVSPPVCHSATIPLALTALLATLDTLVTAKLAQVPNFGRIMSWKEITTSYVFEKLGRQFVEIWQSFMTSFSFSICLSLLSFFFLSFLIFFLLLVRLLTLGVLENLLISFIQTLTNTQNRRPTAVRICTASILRVFRVRIQLQSRKLSG